VHSTFHRLALFLMVCPLLRKCLHAVLKSTSQSILIISVTSMASATTEWTMERRKYYQYTWHHNHAHVLDVPSGRWFSQRVKLASCSTPVERRRNLRCIRRFHEGQRPLALSLDCITDNKEKVTDWKATATELYLDREPESCATVLADHFQLRHTSVLCHTCNCLLLPDLTADPSHWAGEGLGVDKCKLLMETSLLW